MRQRVKPWTRWHGGILVPSMSGAGTVTLPVPDAPVIAADTLSSSSIEITLVSGEGDVFQIERSLNGSDWTQISADATFPYAATGLSASTLYYFRCRARYTGGQWSEYSSVVSDTTEAAAGNEFAHGDLVTITGSGFGSMPAFAFAGGASGVLESTTTGQVPNSGANSNDSPGTRGTFNWTRYDRDPIVGVDASRGKVIQFSLAGNGTSNNIECAQEFRFPSGQDVAASGGRLYMSYYHRGSFANAGDPAQHKLFRICGESNISDTATNLVCHYLAGGMNVHENPAGSSILFYGNSGSFWSNNGNWFRIECRIITNTQGTRNGQVSIRVFNGSNVPAPNSYTGSGGSLDIRTQCLNYNSSTRYGSVIWQNWLGNGYTNGTFANDDHYVSWTTFRRVELWNSATPASATRRNICRPNSWSSGAVEAEVNADGFSAGTAHLVVLDDSLTDTVLASREIVLTS